MRGLLVGWGVVLVLEGLGGWVDCVSFGRLGGGDATRLYWSCLGCWFRRDGGVWVGSNARSPSYSGLPPFLDAAELHGDLCYNARFPSCSELLSLDGAELHDGPRYSRIE